MSGLLAAEAVSGLGHVLVYIFVADSRLLIADTLAVKCLVETKV